MVANADVELELEREISEVLRKLQILSDGHQCEVHLYRGDKKKRKDADFKKYWDPDKDSIRIEFSPTKEKVETETTQNPLSSKEENRESGEDQLADLIRALDRAEGRPGYEFISLKWFRDSALSHEGFSWAVDELARHNALREGIDRRWILTSKVANPRSPNFPVTAIRLNRQMPAVNALLGGGSSSLPAFRPISIRGEPLSATVLRDRR